MARLRYLLLLAVLHQLCGAYHILVVFPLAGGSHHILGQGYVRALLEAGHEVTYVTPFPTNKTNSKYHEVDLSDNVKSLDPATFSLKNILNKEVEISRTNMMQKMQDLLKAAVVNENLEAFLSDPTQNFDAVIVEWLLSDIFAAFATVFNSPLIWSSSIEPHWAVMRLIHEPSNPSFNSGPVSTASPPFSFVERLQSLLSQAFFTLGKFAFLTPYEKTLYEEVFGPIIAKRGRTLPPYDEAIFNASFVLSNSHPALSQPISQPPNSKEIGGYYIDPNTKPLPVDMQKLMDEAKHGVIYFSMGSNAKSKDFPDGIKQGLLQVLGSFKQTVIWKFEEDLPNRPKNVHIVQWAPQQSILAHPNCRLFITHGGLLSTIETVYFAVPTVVMPVGADQHLNAVRAVNKGYALKVELSHEMATDMKPVIEEMLNNPKYTETVKTLSKIYHDRLVPTSKELVHWVEHVIKTGGAPHLRSPALMLPWYQKIYLDLALVVLVSLYTIKLALKIVISKIKAVFAKPAPKSKKKNN